MRIGVPREVKSEERRVGLTPDSVREVTDRGHEVYVERGAGTGAGFDDDEYKDRGAIMVPTADELFETAKLIVKVKEPQADRARPPEGRPHAVHLPASRSRPRSGQRPARQRSHRHRLRVGHRPQRPTPPARPHVPGGGPPGHPGRRPLPGGIRRRPGSAAGRGSRCGRGSGHGDRRRGGRHQRGGDGFGARGRRDRAGSRHGRARIAGAPASVRRCAPCTPAPAGWPRPCSPPIW